MVEVAVVSADFVREFARDWLEAWNSGEPGQVAGLCCADVRWNDPALPEPEVGRDAVEDFVSHTFRAFPDFHFEQTAAPLVSEEAPRALAPYRLRGTMLGAYEPFAATGARVALEGVDDWTFRDEKLSRYDTYYDSIGMARQLGIMPAVGSQAERAMAALQHVQTRIRRTMNRRADR